MIRSDQSRVTRSRALSPQPCPPSGTTEQPTVLVVDDEPDVAALLTEFLGEQGYTALAAHTGGEALRRLEDTAVALLLLDLRLPDMDGVEVMRAARKVDGCPEIIIMTGQATLESALIASEEGTAGYILKPVDLSRLAIIARRVLERRHFMHENARLGAENAARLRETEALLNITRAVNSTLEVREALRLACREITRLVGADTGAVYLHEPDSDRLLPFAGYRVPKEMLDTLLTAPLTLREQGFYVPLWRDRRPVLSDDVAADARFSHELFRRFRHQSGLILPLALEGEVAGAFYFVWWTERLRLAERELDLLEHVTAQVAGFLRNARLFEQAERERRRLDVLYEISRRFADAQETDEILSLPVNEATGLLGVEAAGIRLLEGDDLVLRARTESARAVMAKPRIKVGASMSGRVVATGQPVMVEDLVEHERFDPRHKQAAIAEGIHGYLGVPLRLHGQVIGCLAVYTVRRRLFRPDEVSLLSALADQAALAIHRARLYAESRAREREALNLYEVTSELASSLDVDRIVEQITAKTIDLLGSDASGICVYDEARGGLVFSRGLNLDPELTRSLVIKPGEGVAGRAFQEQRPVWTHDRLSDESIHSSPGADQLVRADAPRACLAVPIVSHGEAHGVLMGYFFGPHEFVQKEIQLLTTLAAHAAIAMDNARLFAETRTQQMRLAQILDSTSDGIVLVGRNGHVEAANPRAGELLVFDPARATGLNVADLLAGHFAEPDEYLRAVAALRGPLDDADGPAEGDLALSKLGRVLHWAARATRAASGDPLGCTFTFQDVTREREVSQMKSDFVSFVTHQLRTPLAGIKWMLELAAQEADLPAEVGSYIQDARDAAQRLIGLVNDLLDVSRLERGKITVSRQPVHLGELTRSVLDEMGVLAQERGHRLTAAGADDLPPVMADPQLLRQVVMNLVSNAIKYTPPRGVITVRIERDGRAARWAIRDSGIGIPKESQARLFEKFYRADNVLAVETEGTGLGLYLVRLIMEQLGGRVWCESVEGQGATFSFTLPLAE